MIAKLLTRAKIGIIELILGVETSGQTFKRIVHILRRLYLTILNPLPSIFHRELLVLCRHNFPEHLPASSLAHVICGLSNTCMVVVLEYILLLNYLLNLILCCSFFPLNSYAHHAFRVTNGIN